jgi:hypothetical protein
MSASPAGISAASLACYCGGGLHRCFPSRCSLRRLSKWIHVFLKQLSVGILRRRMERTGEAEPSAATMLRVVRLADEARPGHSPAPWPVRKVVIAGGGSQVHAWSALSTWSTIHGKRAHTLRRSPSPHLPRSLQPPRALLNPSRMPETLHASQ